MLIMVMNWDVVTKMLTLDWGGQFSLTLSEIQQVTPAYLRGYLAFMAVLCVFPYLEENIRCLRAVREAKA
jgi:hypothetical protein